MLFFRQQTNKLTNENCRLIWFRLFVLDAPALTTENQISIPFAFMTICLWLEKGVYPENMRVFWFVLLESIKNSILWKVF